MKILLDENLPRKLKLDFAGHEVRTVQEMKWNGIKNGKLLDLMASNGFTGFITVDKNLKYQQNYKKFFVTIFVLNVPNNTLEVIQSFIPKVLDEISKNPGPGLLEIEG